MSEFSTFLKVNNIPLYLYTIFSLYTSLLMNTWLASTSWILGIMLLWPWVYRYLSETLLSIFWCIYPEVILLNHMAILFLSFYGSAIQFPTAATLFNIPINIIQDSSFSASSPVLICCFVLFCFIVVILMGLR